MYNSEDFEKVGEDIGRAMINTGYPNLCLFLFFGIPITTISALYLNNLI